jgi:hypothetical protein
MDLIDYEQAHLKLSCQPADAMAQGGHTLRSIEKPIGVSSYRVTRELPTPIREEVPTVEDLQEVVTKLRDEMESLRQERSDEE